MGERRPYLLDRHERYSLVVSFLIGGEDGEGMLEDLGFRHQLQDVLGESFASTSSGMSARNSRSYGQPQGSDAG